MSDISTFQHWSICDFVPNEASIYLGRLSDSLRPCRSEKVVIIVSAIPVKVQIVNGHHTRSVNTRKKTDMMTYSIILLKYGDSLILETLAICSQCKALILTCQNTGRHTGILKNWNIQGKIVTKMINTSQHNFGHISCKKENMPERLILLQGHITVQIPDGDAQNCMVVMCTMFHFAVRRKSWFTN